MASADKIAGSDFEQPQAGPQGEPQGWGEYFCPITPRVATWRAMGRLAVRRVSLGRARHGPVAWLLVTQCAIWECRKLAAIAGSADLPE